MKVNRWWSSVCAGLVVASAMGFSAGCGGPTELERQVEARRLTADLHVQFTKAADASSRAVMAETDEMSAASAREAGQARQAVQRDVDALRLLFAPSGYASEAGILQEFRDRFVEYGELDDEILQLAVENTNLKAQRLSFGSAQQEADALREAVDAVVRGAGPDDWRVRAFANAALADVREVQALQAPHIAESDEATMARLEARMTASLARARRDLEALAPLTDAASRARVADAAAALGRFAAINDEIVALSRRNTNVRSLAASLGRKRTLTVICDERLQALQQALAARGRPGAR